MEILRGGRSDFWIMLGLGELVAASTGVSFAVLVDTRSGFEHREFPKI